MRESAGNGEGETRESWYLHTLRTVAGPPPANQSPATGSGERQSDLSWELIGPRGSHRARSLALSPPRETVTAKRQLRDLPSVAAGLAPVPPRGPFGSGPGCGRRERIHDCGPASATMRGELPACLGIQAPENSLAPAPVPVPRSLPALAPCPDGGREQDRRGDTAGRERCERASAAGDATVEIAPASHAPTELRLGRRKRASPQGSKKAKGGPLWCVIPLCRVRWRQGPHWPVRFHHRVSAYLRTLTLAWDSR
jgi:hypothetical protein